MPGSERSPASQRNAPARRLLAGLLVAWSFWLVFRPVKAVETSLSAEARRTYAIVAFALVFGVVWGLFRDEWRWPVTASRALAAALVAGVVIGPAGRSPLVFGVDVAFAAAAVALAFGVIRLGPRPLGPGWNDRARQRRIERFEQRRRGPGGPGGKRRR